MKVQTPWRMGNYFKSSHVIIGAYDATVRREVEKGSDDICGGKHVGFGNAITIVKKRCYLLGITISRFFADFMFL